MSIYPSNRFIYISIPILLFALSCVPSNASKATPENSSSREEYHILKSSNLSFPESVLYDQIDSIIYISNGSINSSGQEGFITKATRQGEVLSLHYIDRLKRPTGMARFENLLFIVDVDSLLVFDLDKENIVKKLSEPITNAGMNDIVVSALGEIFVTASNIDALLTFQKDSLSIWIQDHQMLKWINGITIHNDTIWMVGKNISLLDLKSKKLKLFEVDIWPRDFEGIQFVDHQTFYVSTVEANRLWRVALDKTTELILDGSDYVGDFDYISESNDLICPRGNIEAGDFYCTVIQL